MSSSGSYNFSLTASEIIQSAYEDLGVLFPGQSPSAAQTTVALNRLNMVTKQYQGTSDGAPGIKVHTRQRITLFLAKGQHKYLIGPSYANATTSYGRTTISATEATGQTVLSITSNTDAITCPGTTITMTSGDYIGIQLDDGTIHWTTISGTPSTTVTVLVALPSQASSGKYVWWFTSKAQRFPAWESAVLRDASYTDVPLEIYEEVNQYELGVANKYADGMPTSILIEPLILNTQITLSSQPTDVTKTIVLTVFYPAEDYDATSNDIAFPQEAFRFLSNELGFALSPSVGRWTKEMEQNRTEARKMYLNLNPENSVLYFQPNG